MPGVASSEVVLRAKGSERPYKETKSLVTSGMVSAYIQVIIKCLFYTHMHPLKLMCYESTSLIRKLYCL